MAKFEVNGQFSPVNSISVVQSTVYRLPMALYISVTPLFMHVRIILYYNPSAGIVHTIIGIVLMSIV